MVTEEFWNYLQIIIEPMTTFMKLLDKHDSSRTMDQTGELCGILAVGNSVHQAVNLRIDRICTAIENDLGDIEVQFRDFLNYEPLKITLKTKEAKEGR